MRGGLEWRVSSAPLHIPSLPVACLTAVWVLWELGKQLSFLLWFLLFSSSRKQLCTVYKRIGLSREEKTKQNTVLSPEELAEPCERQCSSGEQSMRRVRPEESLEDMESSRYLVWSRKQKSCEIEKKCPCFHRSICQNFILHCNHPEPVILFKTWGHYFLEAFTFQIHIKSQASKCFQH